jgi:integrase
VVTPAGFEPATLRLGIFERAVENKRPLTELTSGDIATQRDTNGKQQASMSVRKRKWLTRSGDPREAWIVDYIDQHGERHIETFGKKKDADARHADVRVNVRAGTHVAPSTSINVKVAGDSWLKAAESHGLERATIKQYREHVEQHIVPFIGTTKVSELNAQTIRKFEDKLRENGRSPAMIRKVLGSLGSLLADAQEQGLAARNAVRDLRRNRRRGKDAHAERRQKGRLQVGVHIPTPNEIKSLIAGTKGRWRPLLIVAIFTGLRASELRGLRWSDIDFKANELHVRQRADRFNEIGRPKSAAGERRIPFGKFVANTLKEWKLSCPRGELDLIFPNGAGKVESLANVINRGLVPAQIEGGVVVDGKAKYTGMHALRHFYASWCINRPADGGLGLPPKVVQERLGHSSITMTYDRYGHLFPRGDDMKELDAAERSLLR